MSAMKRYCEEVSVDMGCDGEINDAVMDEADRRMGKATLSTRELAAAVAERRGCGVLDLRCEDLSDPCEVCGEGHSVCKLCGGRVECDDPILLCIACNDFRPLDAGVQRGAMPEPNEIRTAP